MRALLVHVSPHRRTLVLAAVLGLLGAAGLALRAMAADRILLIEGGRVRAQGTHVELVEADVLYRELAATQLTA
jgi:ABC-type transport system involved in Fe-S cluster assembly fused permease/ATPase subunit